MGKSTSKTSAKSQASKKHPASDKEGEGGIGLAAVDKALKQVDQDMEVIPKKASEKVSVQVLVEAEGAGGSKAGIGGQEVVVKPAVTGKASVAIPRVALVSPLKRSVKKSALMQNPYHRSMQVFTTRLPLGVAVATAFKPNKNEPAPLGPIMKMFLGKSPEAACNREAYGIDAIVDVRDPTKDLNDNIPKYVSEVDDMHWLMFVKIHDDEKNNTDSNNAKWIAPMVALMDQKAKVSHAEGGFRFKTSFQYAGDNTPAMMKPWDFYLLDYDIVKFSKAIFADLTLAQISASEDTMKALFLDAEHGRAVFQQHMHIGGAAVHSIDFGDQV